MIYFFEFNFIDLRPDFINKNSWTNFSKIEKIEPSIFKNILKSLQTNSHKWSEYFHVSSSQNSIIDLTENDIDLLNETPFDSELNLIQKLILWLCVLPEKANEIIHKYNVYNFGGLISSRFEYDLEIAYKISTSYTPLLTILPKKENSFVNVTSNIINFAKENGFSTKIDIVTLENSNIKFDRLGKAIKESIKTGNWLILENAHHIKEWPLSILKLFYEIKDFNKFQDEENLWKDYKLNIQQAEKDINVSNDKLHINPRFRLWIITESDQIINLPPSLIYDAIKCTPQISDIKQTYQTCQKMLIEYDTVDQERFEEASVLHSVISHNDYVYKHDWHMNDLRENMRYLNEVGGRVTDENYANILYNLIYGSKLNNKTDVSHVKKLINQIIIRKRYDINQFAENSHKFYSKITKQNESK